MEKPTEYKSGDVFTIEGLHPAIRDPNRRWWQFWKPRMVADKDRLATFRVL